MQDGEPRLVGSRCPACGHVTFPRREGCPACRAPGAMTEAALGPGGVVEGSVLLHVSTEETEAPYTLGLVRLDDGPTLLTRVDGADGAGARVVVRADPETDTFWFAQLTEETR